MKTLRISAISYLNTVPFVYGITRSGLLKNFSVEFDVPSECARKLFEGSADIGIVPVAALPMLPYAEILTDYCIGATGKVKTVIMISPSALPDIQTVYLDTDSRTSAMLSRILFRDYWKQNVTFYPLSEKSGPAAPGEALVLIGDKTFSADTSLPLHLDLAEEWMKFTGLPFVFACWVSNKPLSEEQKKEFSDAIEWGIRHRADAVRELNPERYPGVDLEEYLMHTISYPLDAPKKEGMNTFLAMSKTINL